MEDKQKLSGGLKVAIACGVIFTIMMTTMIIAAVILMFKTYKPREEVLISQLETFLDDSEFDYEFHKTDIYTEVEVDGLIMWLSHENDMHETHDRIVEWKEENLGTFWGFFSGSANMNGKNYSLNRKFDFDGNGECVIQVENQFIYIITMSKEGMELQKDFFEEFGFTFFQKE